MSGGGGGNLMVGLNLTKNSFAAYNTITGFNNSMTSANIYAGAIIGGNSNTMNNCTSNNGIFVGNSNTITGVTEADSEPSNVIIGGRFNQISGSNGYNAILGGRDNLITGTTGSVILGGINITASVDNTVYTPNLNVTGSAVISGSVVGKVSVITPSSSTGSMDCSVGNFFTMTLGNATDTRLEASNIQAGQTINLKLTNNSTAAGTISFGPEFQFENNTAFTATPTTSSIDVMTFISFDGTTLQATGLKNFS